MGTAGSMTVTNRTFLTHDFPHLYLAWDPNRQFRIAKQ